MAALKIYPRKLKGSISLPPSKSLAHRAIIAACLAKGKSRIMNIAYSKDIVATIEAMEALGAKIKRYDDYLDIDGTSTYTLHDPVINCFESGSTLRFMIPIALVKENKLKFLGEGKLGDRPLDSYYAIFDQIGIKYQKHPGLLDLDISGKMKAAEFTLPGHISSQFITGLLFALPLLKEESRIIISSPLQSKAYIDLTLKVLADYGIRIINSDYQEFIIPGNQAYQARDYQVEADFSQAAFFLVAGALGNDVKIKGLNLNSLQGDRDIITYLEAMGASLVKEEDLYQMRADQLRGTIIDGSQAPDVMPVLSLAMALAKGHSDIVNAQRLRIKECDRLRETRRQLNILGAQVEEGADSLHIDGVNHLTGGICSCANDHRMAMMLAIGASRCQQPVIIDNKECVRKSYPNFWEDYCKLGGEINEFNLEE